MATSSEWFKFYPGDWLTSREVRRMTPVQRGYFIQLLAESWEKPLPTTLEDLAWLAGADTVEEFKANGGEFVIAQFEGSDGKLVHGKIEQLRAEYMERSESARSKAKSRWNKSTSTPAVMPEQCSSSADALPAQSVGNAIRGEESRGEEKREEVAPSQAPAPAPAESLEPKTRKQQPRTADTRLDGFVDLVFKRYEQANGVKPQWDKSEGKAAKDLLASLPAEDWTLEKLDRCLQLKLISRNKAKSERPRNFLPHLADYLDAPKNEFGQPDYALLHAWERKTQPSTPKPQPVPQMPTLPEPAPEVAEYMAAHPGSPWAHVLVRLAEKINRHSFDTWLKPTRYYGAGAKCLYVQVPTSEFTQIGEKYGDMISEAFFDLGMPFEHVEFFSPEVVQ